jgi:hypothetical protein
MLSTTSADTEATPSPSKNSAQAQSWHVNSTDGQNLRSPISPFRLAPFPAGTRLVLIPLTGHTSPPAPSTAQALQQYPRLRPNRALPLQDSHTCHGSRLYLHKFRRPRDPRCKLHGPIRGRLHFKSNISGFQRSRRRIRSVPLHRLDVRPHLVQRPGGYSLQLEDLRRRLPRVLSLRDGAPDDAAQGLPARPILPAAGDGISRHFLPSKRDDIKDAYITWLYPLGVITFSITCSS